MEDGEWHCLVAFADGTTSLYTSSAFGVIRAGEHLLVRKANDGLLRAAASELTQLAPSTTVELPNSGHVTIRVLTVDGHAVVTAPETDVGEGRHPASNLFHAAHEVIAQLRLATVR